jgi:hypothetical protein
LGGRRSYRRAQSDARRDNEITKEDNLESRLEIAAVDERAMKMAVEKANEFAGTVLPFHGKGGKIDRMLQLRQFANRIVFCFVYVFFVNRERSRTYELRESTCAL